ncbi:MAG: GNAT family N-acetyltransferase [Bacteroidota bacterium]
MTIREAVTPEHIEVARALFCEYAASLSIDLAFQHFSEELAALPGPYVPPSGGLFIAWDEDLAIGCVALRPLEPPEIAELKRLFVRPGNRGRGIGMALCRTALDRARTEGYTRVRLDTLPDMHDARRLYTALGFRKIPPYCFNPIEGAIFMEVSLGDV